MKIQYLIILAFLLSFSVLIGQVKEDAEISQTQKTTSSKIVKPTVDKSRVPASVQAVNSTDATTAVSYDFTTGSGQYHGGAAAAKEVSPGVWAMIAGDANASGSINTTDYLVVKPDVGSTGYYNTDVNMSGSVNTTDYLIIKPNVGKISQLP